MTFLRSLIAIATLSSFACATSHKQKPPVAAASQPVSKSPLNGIREIDPENPPTVGLWMSWVDGLELAKFMRSERIGCEIREIELTAERDTANIRLQQADKALANASSPAKTWWTTWGFPIGLAAGIALGLIIPLTVIGSR